MPNINTTMYLADADYDKYITRKKEILNKMRDYIRKELGVEQKGDINENKNK